MMTKKRKELLKILDSYHKTYHIIKKVFHALRKGEDKGDSRVKEDFVLGIEKFKELRYKTKEKADQVEQLKNQLSVLQQQKQLLQISSSHENVEESAPK